MAHSLTRISSSCLGEDGDVCVGGGGERGSAGGGEGGSGDRSHCLVYM